MKLQALQVAAAVTVVCCSHASAASRTVTDADVLPWPLVSRSGILRCEPAGELQIVTIETAGEVYALNGTARARGYADIEPIWLDNVDIPGAKVSIGALIDTGRALCET